MNSCSSGFHPFPHLLTIRDVAYPHHRQEPRKELFTGTCWGFLRVFEPPPSKAKSYHPCARRTDLHRRRSALICTID